MVPRMAVPDYDHKGKNLSLHISVPSPTSRALAARPPIAAEASAVLAPRTLAPVAGGSPMDKGEIPLAPVTTAVAPAVLLPLMTVPGSVARSFWP